MRHFWSRYLWFPMISALLATQVSAVYGQNERADGSGATGREPEGILAKNRIEVLTRGPVHEAFAQPVNLGRGLAAVISRPPPASIMENPPELTPEAENVAWIPGYWMWDGDREDFIWVSGVWRVPPPGTQWIAGYWARVSGGYRWAPGLWTQTDLQEIEYYPTPPAPLNQGASAESPSADDFWAPGYWNWQGDHFVWNAGYWAKAKPGWLWVPSSYSWSPRGYVFSRGYWDFALENRGLLFTPLGVNAARRSAATHTPQAWRSIQPC